MKFIKDIDQDSYLVELEDGTRGTMNKYSRNFLPFPDSSSTSPMYGESEENMEALSALDTFNETRESSIPENDFQNIITQLIDPKGIGQSLAKFQKGSGQSIAKPSMFEELQENIEFDLGAQTDEAGGTIFPDLENKSLTEILPQIADSVRNNTFNSKFVKDMISESMKANDPAMGALSSDLAVLTLISPKLSTWFKGLTKVDDIIRKGINMVKTWKAGNKEFGELAKREGIDPKNIKEAEMLMDKASSVVTRGTKSKPFDMKKSTKDMEGNVDADILGFYQNLGEKSPIGPTASETAKFDQQRAIMTHLLDMDDMNIMDEKWNMKQSAVPSDEDSSDLGTMDTPKSGY